MKKFAPILALLAFFMFAAPKAEAQLNFYNGTPCPVQVFVAFSFSASPCSGPICQSNWSVAPTGFSVIPAISSSPCLQPFPPVGANYVRLLVRTLPGVTAGVSACGSPVTTTTDCSFAPRTVQVFGFNFAAIY